LEAVDDAGDESDEADYDGERRKTSSAFVSDEGEKQQYGDERDKNHVNCPSAAGHR
jgi:hypothetical protein